MAAARPPVPVDGPGAPSDDVGARYARPARRGRTVVAVAVGVVAVLVSVVLVSTAVLRTEVRWRDVAFAVVDEETVRVTFEVYGGQGERVRCVVRAADSGLADVGQVEVDLGPLPRGGERRTVQVRTVAEASTASVRTCAPLP